MQHHYAKVGAGISEYRTNRSGICPDGLIEMKSAPPHCEWKANQDGTYNELPPTNEQLAQARQSEMVIELNWCDLQLNLHASGDSRAVATLDDIHAHARASRDHVRDVDKDGILEIVGEKPVRPE